MKILITGGAGFIGSHTADALLVNGHEVRILDVLDPQIHGPSARFPGYLDPRVECIQGDVCDIDTTMRALDDMDAVYHFASKTGVGQSLYDISSYVFTNVVGTATLLEAIIKRNRPLQRLVLSSSRAVYGEGTCHCAQHGDIYPGVRTRRNLSLGDYYPHCPVCDSPVQAIATRENRPLHPISIYGWTKKHQEDMCQYISDTYNIPLAVLRYFNVYGSRQALNNPYTGVITILYSRILSGNPGFLYEQGLPLRDFVHVHDVVQANILALTMPVQHSQVVNVGSGEFMTIGKVAQSLATALGRDASLQLTDEFRIGDIFSCVADMEQAENNLGYRPRISLEQGMNEFVNWAKNQVSVDNYEITVQELRKHGLFGQAKPDTA